MFSYTTVMLPDEYWLTLKLLWSFAEELISNLYGQTEGNFIKWAKVYRAVHTLFLTVGLSPCRQPMKTLHLSSFY